MQVGVPREIKPDEFRIGLTPAAVGEYVAHGHDVLVESGAGEGIDAGNESYLAVGAKIAANAAEVFASAEMIVKVKEPQSQELTMLRPGQILFAYLHLAADPAQAKALLASGASAIAYETVTDEAGHLPLLAPMSEVAGRLAVQAAATALEKHYGGRGLLLSGVPGVPPANVLILGCGVVGANAARIAVGMGARVTVIDRSLERLRQLDDLFAGAITTLYSTREAIAAEVKSADVVIGAVLIAGAAAPKLLRRDMLATMRRGSVIVDVAIDQGGCFETSHPTTHHAPTFEMDGVIHYCVANMPGAVPHTSSHALNHATLPFGLALADHGLAALIRDPHLCAGLNVHRGRITHKAVADSLALPFTDPRDLLKS